MKKTIFAALLLGAAAPMSGFGVVNPGVSLNGCTPSGTSCSACTSYKCDVGYYGTATSSSSGCTECPANATCSGGNKSTFFCVKGYYKTGSTCSQCPASGGVYGTTATAGATSITECYIPSGTLFFQTNGSGEYTGDCYYQN